MRSCTMICLIHQRSFAGKSLTAPEFYLDQDHTSAARSHSGYASPLNLKNSERPLNPSSRIYLSSGSHELPEPFYGLVLLLDYVCPLCESVPLPGKHEKPDRLPPLLQDPVKLK